MSITEGSTISKIIMHVENELLDDRHAIEPLDPRRDKIMVLWP